MYVPESSLTIEQRSLLRANGRNILREGFVPTYVQALGKAASFWQATSDTLGMVAFVGVPVEDEMCALSPRTISLIRVDALTGSEIPNTAASIGSILIDECADELVTAINLGNFTYNDLSIALDGIQKQQDLGLVYIRQDQSNNSQSDY